MRSFVKTLTAVGVALTVAATTLLGGSSAFADARDGSCDIGEFCYYYNSNETGSVSDLPQTLGNYGSSAATCYVFKGSGNGKGTCVKNHAASVWNRSDRTIRVYYNSNFAGAHQDFSPGQRANFNATMRNNNASHRPIGHGPDDREPAKPNCKTVGHGDRSGPAGNTSGTPAERIARVIAAAKSKTGRDIPYSWGGGGRSGPTCGIDEVTEHGYNDFNVLGFDCSGLMQYAFWAGTGVNIGGRSSDQSLKGTRIAYREAKAGDLIFWGPRGHTNHVALLIGHGKMIESTRDGANSVRVTSIYGSHSFAVRVLK